MQRVARILTEGGHSPPAWLCALGQTDWRVEKEMLLENAQVAQKMPVIIPSCNPWNLGACLTAIKVAKEHERPFVIVNSCANFDAMYAVIRDAGFQNIIMLEYGERRFNFSRAINVGLDICQDMADGVFLLNDDAQLVTPYGFTKMEVMSAARGHNAILSARIQGVAAGASQTAGPHTRVAQGLLAEPFFLAFICVLIGGTVLTRAGRLDEDFTGYGQEDVEYSMRARQYGGELLTYIHTLVRHDGSIPSTYRTRKDIEELAGESKRVMMRKMGTPKWSTHPMAFAPRGLCPRCGQAGELRDAGLWCPDCRQCWPIEKEADADNYPD